MNNVHKNLEFASFLIGYNLLQYAISELQEELKGDIMKLSWRNVLNSSHGNHGNMFRFYRDIVVPSGYTYFVWNDIIYENISWGNIVDTGYKVEDIE